MIPDHTEAVSKQQRPEYIFRGGPLCLSKLMQSECVEHTFQKTELRAVYVLKPHCGKRNGTYDIRQIDNGSEKFLSSDTARKDDTKEQ